MTLVGRLTQSVKISANGCHQTQLLLMSLWARAPKSAPESMHDHVTARVACMHENVATQNETGNLLCCDLQDTCAVLALPNIWILKLAGATEYHANDLSAIKP